MVCIELYLGVFRVKYKVCMSTGIPSAPLAPIVENQEDYELEQQTVFGDASTDPNVAMAGDHGNPTWEHPMRYHHGNNLPTSLPEIPSAVSPNPVSPQYKARQNWMKAVEVRIYVCRHGYQQYPRTPLN